ASGFATSNSFTPSAARRQTASGLASTTIALRLIMPIVAIVHSKPMTTSPASEAAGRAARALLAAESVGVLSTISVHRPGFPYGSVPPYALPPQGAPLLLLSRLAAHTKNLAADPRSCLFVGDRSAAEDPQAGARISLLGRMASLPAPDEPEARN